MRHTSRRLSRVVLLCSQVSVEPHSPKGPEHIKITTLYRCTGRRFRAATRPVWSESPHKKWVLSYPLSAQGRLLSDWAEAQADLSLRWAHSHFVGFVMRRSYVYSHSSKCSEKHVLRIQVRAVDAISQKITTLIVMIILINNVVFLAISFFIPKFHALLFFPATCRNFNVWLKHLKVFHLVIINVPVQCSIQANIFGKKSFWWFKMKANCNTFVANIYFLIVIISKMIKVYHIILISFSLSICRIKTDKVKR